MANEDLVTCTCGSVDFEVVEIKNISKFWVSPNEFKEGKFERGPAYVNLARKLRCIKCNTFYGEVNI